MTDEHKAIANGYDVPISTKQSVEVCNFVRGKNTTKAKSLLEQVIEHKLAVPYTRYFKEIPHRKGNIRTGRWPIQTCKAILSLIKTAEANADNKGLNLQNLVITHISAHKGGNSFHYGRKRGIKMKVTHLKLEVEEQVVEKKEPKGVKKR
jgi:large subunit ribosomal protein L22